MGIHGDHISKTSKDLFPPLSREGGPFGCVGNLADEKPGHPLYYFSKGRAWTRGGSAVRPGKLGARGCATEGLQGLDSPRVSSRSRGLRQRLAGRSRGVPSTGRELLRIHVPASGGKYRESLTEIMSPRGRVVAFAPFAEQPGPTKIS